PDIEAGGLVPGTTLGRPPAANNPVAQAAIAQANALHLSSQLRPEKRDAEVPESFSLTLGKTFDLGNNLELGVVLAGTSSNGDEATRDITFGRSLNPGPDGTSATGDDFLNRTQNEDRYMSYAGYGLLGSIGLRAGDRHEISFTAFRNHRAEDEVVQARRIRDRNSSFGEYAGPGTNTSTPFGATAATFQGLDSIIPLRRTLDLLQATGHHEVGDEDHPYELDWQYSRSSSLEERPGTRTTYFSQLDFTDPSIQNIPGAVYNPSLGQIDTLWDVFGLNPPASETFRETLRTSEESANSRMDLTVPVWNDGEDWFKLKTGVNHFDRTREVRGRLFTYTIGQTLNDQLGSVDGGQYGIDFLNWLNGITGPNGLPIFNGHANGNTSGGIFIDEDTASGNTVRNVDAGTTVTAAYLQGDLKVGDWSVIGGARFESEERTFEVLRGLNPTGTIVPFTSVKNDYLLPAININRNFGDDDQFKTTFAWSRTVARPTFFEFAPIRTVDQASGDTFQGNPNLTDTLIDNYDLRWEWTPEPTSLLAVSLFHKQLDSPIAQAYSLGDRTFINGDSGSLQGVELEGRKRFLEHWTVASNFTFIDSQLEFQQQNIFGSQTGSTTFDGQPDYIFNLMLGWDHEELGLSATLNYNFTGSYLTSVPLGAAEPPVRRDDYHQLDLVLQKRFELSQGVGIVKLNFGNLLDSTDTQRFDGTDLIYSSYRRGRTYGLEFEYRF
ncbi:MAG: TonB-dependent receptor, partial [Verrucomicrobiaceae bacterium]